MTSKPTLRLVLFAIFFMGPTVSMQATAIANPSVDHTLFAGLLAKYVTDGRVDYGGFKSEETRLDEYLRILEKVDVGSLSRNDQLAFYVNVYNAWTIKLILSGYPGVSSIKDLGNFFQSPWKKKIVRIAGDVITLDNLEHDILRPRFKDPRIHFAINCAAKSCPPLRAVPFQGDVLEKQLNAATVSFLNDPKQYRFEGTTFYISRIFKWFAEDFNNDALQFYLQYAQADLKNRLQANRNQLRIDYLEYDWGLNAK